MLIGCIVLKVWGFEFFVDLAWNAYLGPRNFGFWGVRTPKRDWSSSRLPKGTSLADTALSCQIWCRLVHWCDLGACWRNQKKRKKKGKERNLQWQTGCSPRPPTLTQRYVVLHAGWSSGCSSKFQVSSKSGETFSSCGGSKIAISYT